MRSALIDVEDLYDEFNYGRKSPQAIKDFLSQAQAAWSKKPRFVLLAGNAYYDPRDYVGDGGKDLLPTHFIETRVPGNGLGRLVRGFQ